MSGVEMPYQLLLIIIHMCAAIVIFLLHKTKATLYAFIRHIMNNRMSRSYSPMVIPLKR